MSQKESNGGRKSGNFTQAALLVAYAGTSMYPTLREPEMIEVLPYAGRPVRIGDVIYFLPAEGGRPIVHRVARMTSAGIVTRGDNCAREDSFRLQPEDVRGRVLYAWRGRKRRKIAGGPRGRLAAKWVGVRRILDRGMSPLLHLPYRLLSRTGLLARLLPAPLRPRVIVFRVQGRDQFRLLLGSQAIGRFDDRQHRWQIQRPFRLLVDEHKLPGNRALDGLIPPKTVHRLDLVDGTRWMITAGDEGALPLVNRLGEAMKLRLTDPSDPPCAGRMRRLLVSIDPRNPEFLPSACYGSSPPEEDGAIVCALRPTVEAVNLFVLFIQISFVIACDAQEHGGILVHGALAERDGAGVILAAPGGLGKTTASGRLAAPWRSLCDDTTLVMRDPQGAYWAHPWPTWSRFLEGGPGGSWDVEKAVPLTGIFCLSRASENRAEPIGPGKAASLIVGYVEQATRFQTHFMGLEEVRSMRLTQFKILCELAKAVPAYILHISLTGPFWHAMEQALEASGKKPEEGANGNNLYEERNISRSFEPQVRR